MARTVTVKFNETTNWGWIYIDGVEVGYGPRKAVEDLRDEITADPKKCDMVYNFFCKQEDE